MSSPYKTAAKKDSVFGAFAERLFTQGGQGRKTADSSLLSSTPSSGLENVSVEDISPNPTQPRKVFSLDSLCELALSILREGLLQPITVTAQTVAEGSKRFTLIAGERRWRAFQLLANRSDPSFNPDELSRIQVQLRQQMNAMRKCPEDFLRIPAYVVDKRSDQFRQAALIENLQRENLCPTDELFGYLDLLTDRLSVIPEFHSFAESISSDEPYAAIVRLLRKMENEQGGKSFGEPLPDVLKKTVASAFDSIGRLNWHSFTRHRLPVLKFPVDVVEALNNGQITFAQAKELSNINAEALGVSEEEAETLRARLIANPISAQRIKAFAETLAESKQMPLRIRTTLPPVSKSELKAKFSFLADKLAERIEVLSSSERKQLMKLFLKIEQILAPQVSEKEIEIHVKKRKLTDRLSVDDSLVD